MANLVVVHDMAAGFCHFEPFKVLDAFAGFGQSVLDSVFNGGGGRSDDFDFLVRVMIPTAGSLESAMPFCKV